ncbi:MAG: twin-arginine translocation pathway signal protein [Roseobacter sp. MedPE-SWchi]|nr:MAG: twin-arginine translocation pathway signal protein [Roseobacter sp. MedPE-SWchi]
MEVPLALRPILVALALIVSFAPLSTRAEVPIFSARNGVALDGYDVVAFFQGEGAVVGHQNHALMWKGVVWRFVSLDNQARFEANPRAYAPVFGGYCAYAMSQGYLAPGDPRLWRIDDGELLLLNNASVQAIWQQEARELLQAARGNWPAVLRD